MEKIEKGKKIQRTFSGKVVETKDGHVIVDVSPITLDRDKEVILPSGWMLDQYKQHSPLMDSHNYDSIVNQIGKASARKTERGLQTDIEYWTGKGNFAADWGYFIATQGQAAYSVGFIPYEYTEDIEEIKELLKPYDFSTKDIQNTRRVYIKQALLETSQVAVPANPLATQQNGFTKFIFKTYKLQEPVEKKDAEEKDFEVLKPYPNEHSCRLNSPSKYDKFRRKKCAVKSDDKCIDFIFGIKDGKSELQAMRYNIDIWTEAAAKAHCKGKEGMFEPAKPEKETESTTKDVREMVALADLIGYLNSLLFAFRDNGVNGKDIEKMSKALRLLMEVAQSQAAMGEKEFKSGRVLSAKNIKIIKEAIKTLEELLILSEPDKSLLGDSNETKEVLKRIINKYKF